MTEASHLTAVRESYDTVAVAYAAQVPAPAQLDPLSRALLAAFAETVRAADLGPVADLGCGPGKVTAHLAGLGVPAFGLDLSPGMVGLARTAHPGLRFAVGSMTALPLADRSLGGILAYYSTHHTPTDRLPGVFAEFHRVLAPGGHLMLAGHVGEEGVRQPRQAYGGHTVTYTSHLLPPPRVLALLRGAGFALDTQVVDEPAAGATRTHATLLAHRPPKAPEGFSGSAG